MSTTLAKKQPTWAEIVGEVMPQFNKIAERYKTVLWNAEYQFAIQALQKNKKLSECVPYTVQNAVINVAAVGLTLNPADAYAYLVPEWNKSTGQNECQLRISFKGLIKVATDSGAISWVKAEPVKEADEFEYRGISEPPLHKMNPFSDRGVTVGFYCVAKTNDGDYLVDTIDMAQIALIKACAKTEVVWNQWPDEMGKKSTVKRASKQWPKTDKSSRLHKAIEIINETEGSDPGYLIYTPEQRETFNDLFEEKNALQFFAFTQTIDNDVYGALVNSSKDEVRAERGATQRGKDIIELFNEGRRQIQDMRFNIVNLANDKNVDAVQKQFLIAEELGVRKMIVEGFSEEEASRIKSLKEPDEPKKP